MKNAIQEPQIRILLMQYFRDQPCPGDDFFLFVIVPYLKQLEKLQTDFITILDKLYFKQTKLLPLLNLLETVFVWPRQLAKIKTRVQRWKVGHLSK